MLDWASAHVAETLTVDVLARRALMSPRTFARRFAAATGTTPHRWLLETTDLPIYEVARQCGLGSPDTLRHHFLRRRRTGPQSYRRTFQATVSATTPHLGSPG